MCGILAAYNPAGPLPAPERFRPAVARLAHRGPDDSGEYSTRGLYFGHRRLAILDLSPLGHQPMLSPDGRVAVIFNGQIYNHLELRRELEAGGYRFKSTCDTETIVAAYEKWGADAIPRLRGMWALAIWDNRDRTLLVSRDRFGIKPLYHHVMEDGTQVFASEIKAILALANHPPRAELDVVQRYLARGWIGDVPESLFAGISLLPPASIMVWQDGKLKKQETFWSPPTPTQTRHDVREIYDVFREATAEHLQSDAPVALALSGGIDSTAIACMMAHDLGLGTRVKAFSVRTPDVPDESPLIDRTVALTGIEHEYIDVGAIDFAAAVDAMLLAHDEPTFSVGQMIQLIMRREVARQGYKVLLVGDGADEVFAGYRKVLPLFVHDLLAAGRCEEARRALRGSLDLTQYDLRGQLDRQRQYEQTGIPGRMVQEHRLGYAVFNDAHQPDDTRLFPLRQHPQLQGIAGGERMYGELLNRISIDFPYVTRNEDRNAMANSLESRPVFMDHRLVETAWTYPFWMFMADGRNKTILRDAMAPILTPEVGAHRTKYVRPGSNRHLMYDYLAEPMRDLLTSQQVRKAGIWRDDLLAQYDADRAIRSRDNAAVWFRFYQFQRWQSLYDATIH